MLKIQTINIPIYKGTVHLIFGDGSEAQDYLSDIYQGDFSFNLNTTEAICFAKGTTMWIWLRNDFTVPTLVHELCHAVFNLMEELGIHTSDQEVFCYLIEYLMLECINIGVIQMDHINQAKDVLDKEGEQV